jgi:uncharacterized membrane protein YeaQ/YmgE (transglycosylase-associated protein family)
MTILISLILGAAILWFISFLVDLPCSTPRNIAICCAGALVGGALIPALLAISGPVVAIIGAIIGAALGLALFSGCMRMRVSGQTAIRAKAPRRQSHPGWTSPRPAPRPWA